jgi:hypothetical protein
MPNYTVILESKGFTRVLGTINIIAGTLEIGVSVPITYATGGFGIPLSGIIATHGASTFNDGVHMIWTGTPGPNLFEKILTPLVGRDIAFTTDLSLGIVTSGGCAVIRGFDLYKKFGVFSPKVFPNTINDKIRNLFHHLTRDEIRATQGTQRYKWVITTDGELIVGKPKVHGILDIYGKPKVTDFLKHSDLANGAKVVGAGEATFTNGLLVGRGAINSYSGHYMPWGNTKLVETVFKHHGFSEASGLYIDVAKLGLLKGSKRATYGLDPLLEHALTQMYAATPLTLGKTQRLFARSESPMMYSYVMPDDDALDSGKEFSTFDFGDTTPVAAKITGMANAGIPTSDIMQHLAQELMYLSSGIDYQTDHQAADKAVKATLIDEYTKQYIANLQRAEQIRVTQAEFAAVIDDMRRLEGFAQFIGKFDPKAGEILHSLNNAAIGVLTIATQALSPLAIFGSIFGILNNIAELFGTHKDPNEDVKKMIDTLGNYVHKGFTDIHNAMKGYSDYQILAMESYYNATRDLCVRGFRQLAEQGQINYGSLKLLTIQSAHSFTVLSSMEAKVIGDIEKVMALLTSEGFSRVSSRARRLLQEKIYTVEDLYRYIDDVSNFAHDPEYGALSYWATESSGHVPSFFKINVIQKKLLQYYSDKFVYTGQQANLQLIIPLIINLARMLSISKVALDFNRLMRLIDQILEPLLQYQKFEPKFHHPVLSAAIFSDYQKDLKLLRDVVLDNLKQENSRIDLGEYLDYRKIISSQKASELSDFRADKAVEITADYGRMDRDTVLAEIKEKYCQEIFPTDEGFYQCDKIDGSIKCFSGTSLSPYGRQYLLFQNGGLKGLIGCSMPYGGGAAVAEHERDYQYELLFSDQPRFADCRQKPKERAPACPTWYIDESGRHDVSCDEYAKVAIRVCQEKIQIQITDSSPGAYSQFKWFGNSSATVAINITVAPSDYSSSHIQTTYGIWSFPEIVRVVTKRTLLAPHKASEEAYSKEQSSNIIKSKAEVESMLSDRPLDGIVPALVLYPLKPGYPILPSPSIDLNLLDEKHCTLIQKNLATVKLTYESTADNILLYVNLQSTRSKEETADKVCTFKIGMQNHTLFLKDEARVLRETLGGEWPISETGTFKVVKLEGEHNQDLVHVPIFTEYKGLAETGLPKDVVVLHSASDLAKNITQRWLDVYQQQREIQLRALRHVFQMDVYQPLINHLDDIAEIAQTLCESYEVLSKGNSSYIKEFYQSGSYVVSAKQLEEIIKHGGALTETKLNQIFEDTFAILEKIKQQIDIVNQLTQYKSSTYPPLDLAIQVMKGLLKQHIKRVQIHEGTERFIPPHFVEQYPSQVTLCSESTTPLACVQIGVLKIIANNLGVVFEMPTDVKNSSKLQTADRFSMHTYECEIVSVDKQICRDSVNNWKREITIYRNVTLSWGEEGMNLDVYKCRDLEGGVPGKYCEGLKTEYIETPLVEIEISTAEPSTLNILGSAALYGATYAALPEAMGDLLYLYGCISEQNASRVKFAASLLLLGLSGSWLGTGTGMVTHKALTYAGVSDSKARITANTAAFVVNTGGKITPTGVAATVTSYLGGRFGLWAEKCLVSRLRDRQPSSSAAVLSLR